MTNHVQTPENNERLKRYFTALERMSGAMEKLFSLKKPSIAGESFYTDRDLSEKLKISRRSLQYYRNISLFSLVFILHLYMVTCMSAYFCKFASFLWVSDYSFAYVCLFVCICLLICLHTSAYLFAYVCLFVCIRLLIRMHISAYLFTRICTSFAMCRFFFAYNRFICLTGICFLDMSGLFYLWASLFGQDNDVAVGTKVEFLQNMRIEENIDQTLAR